MRRAVFIAPVIGLAPSWRSGRAAGSRHSSHFPAAGRRGARRPGAQEDERVPGQAPAVRRGGGGELRRGPRRTAEDGAHEPPPGGRGAPQPPGGRRHRGHPQSRFLVRREDGHGARQGAQRVRDRRGRRPPSTRPSTNSRRIRGVDSRSSTSSTRIPTRCSARGSPTAATWASTRRRACPAIISSSPRTTIEWQIWIDASDQPLPRKLVINYVHEPGEPQYSAVLRRWNLDPQFPDDLFTFEAPEGAQKVDAKAMARPSEGDKPAASAGSGRWTMTRHGTMGIRGSVVVALISLLVLPEAPAICAASAEQQRQSRARCAASTGTPAVRAGAGRVRTRSGTTPAHDLRQHLVALDHRADPQR